MAPSKAHKSPPSRLKLVVRRLPPDLPEAVFWRSVAPWVAREEAGEAQQGAAVQDGAEVVPWAVYKAGKVRKSGQDKDSVHSRAYISFKTPEALVAFHRGYDGWSFRDKQGNVSQAVVEFAPYQRMPVAPSKQDPRQGTIDEDSEFLAFSEALKAAPAPVQMPTEIVSEAPKTTPLIDHLRQQKAAERAARKQAQAIKKGKQPAVLPGATKAQLATAAQGGVQGAVPKNGKNGKKEKNGGGGKEKKGKGKASKETSRSGTPVPGGAEGGGGAGGKKQQQRGGGSTPSSSSAPQTPLPPAGQIPYPPGSVGAQQQQAQRNATLQAQLVRQQLQAQHQRQQGRAPPQPAAGPAPVLPPGIVAPQPQILRNPARASPSAHQPASPAPPPAVQALGSGALAGAQIAQQQQQQRRQQAGAAMVGVVGEGVAARQQQGQGQGQGGKGGGGRGGRGGGGGGRGRGGGGGGGRGRGGRGGGKGGAASGGGGAAP